MTSRVIRALGALGVVIAAASATGCQGEERGEPLGGGRDDGSLPLAVRTALDEGNNFYRARQYDSALGSYRQAAAAAPSEAAPWYGVYMAATAMGDQSLADSALTRINQLGSAEGALSDSAMREMHTGGGDGAGALPPGHPATGGQDAGALPPGHPTTPPTSLPRAHPPIGSGGAP